MHTPFRATSGDDARSICAANGACELHLRYKRRASALHLRRKRSAHAPFAPQAEGMRAPFAPQAERARSIFTANGAHARSICAQTERAPCSPQTEQGLYIFDAFGPTYLRNPGMLSPTPQHGFPHKIPTGRDSYGPLEFPWAHGFPICQLDSYGPMPY